jgi:uncharacterized protein
VNHFLSPLVSSPHQRWGLRDAATGRVLAARLETAFDSQSRKKGLLGRDRFEPGSGLVIAPCGGIHTFFMRFPIDVLFAARDGRVVNVHDAVRPWRLALGLRGFCAIELPAHVARDGGVRVGHRLELFAADDPALTDRAVDPTGASPQ